MMRNPISGVGAFLLPLFSCSLSQGALIAYNFTGGALTPELTGVPAGVTVTNITIGGGLDLSGGTDALRFESGDTGSATGTAISSGAYLSFTLTIDASTVINLTTLTAAYNTTLSGSSYSNSRIYTSIDGTDDVTGDTIGVIGKQSPDATGAGTNTLNLANPLVNSMRGGNVNAGDLSNLTNRSVTFYVPWVDSGSGSYFTDLDSLSLAFDVVPEPAAAMMSVFGLLPLFRRRR